VQTVERKQHAGDNDRPARNRSQNRQSVASPEVIEYHGLILIAAALRIEALSVNGGPESVSAPTARATADDA